MKFLLPREHGAWAMWLAPFIIGILTTRMNWAHLLLLISIFFAYISISAFLQGIRRPSERRSAWRYAGTYFAIALLAGLPLLYLYPMLIYIPIGVIPIFAGSLYYVKQKKERALLNDLLAILALNTTFFASSMLGYGNLERINSGMFILYLWQILFFFGSVLFVKSLIREKHNPVFKRAATIYMALLPIIGFIFSGVFMMTAYLFSTIRLFAVPPNKAITSKTIGIIEIFNTIWFSIFISLSV